MKRTQLMIRPMPVSGDKVRAAIERSGLSASEVAARVGVALPNLSRLMNGRNPNPKVNLLEAIAKACRCKVDDLLEK